jgi:small subunit ribosomal protein S18
MSEPENPAEAYSNASPVNEAPAAQSESASVPQAATGQEASSSADQGPSSAARGRPFRGAPPGRGRERKGRRRFGRGKVCGFCVEKVRYIDYKDVRRLRRFMTERGKILTRRVSGACASHQRMLTHAIHRARVLALLPFKV